jgi:hypothetical protein
VNARPSAVLMAGGYSALSATLEAAFLREDILVHWVKEPESVDASSRPVSNLSRAVLQIALPANPGQEVTSFRRRTYEQLRGLAAVMPDGAVILVVVDARNRTTTDRPGARQIASIMTRLRAAVAREAGKTVTVNAVLHDGSVDDGTVAARIRDAMCAPAFPDTGFLVLDRDIVDQSIVHAIAEQCS